MKAIHGLSAPGQLKAQERKGGASVQADQQTQTVSTAKSKAADEVVVTDKLGMQTSAASNTTQAQPAGPSAETSSKGKGIGKNGHIPPGLAKKGSAGLPDGNPWKAVLAAQEEAEAARAEAAKKAETAKADEAKKAQEAAKQAETQQADAAQEMLKQMQLILAQITKLIQAQSAPATTAETKPAVQPAAGAVTPAVGTATPAAGTVTPATGTVTPATGAATGAATPAAGATTPVAGAATPVVQTAPATAA